MNLQRTTIRLPEDLIAQAQQYALSNKTSLQEVHRRALTKFIADETVKKVKKRIEFATFSLGHLPDPLTREFIYEE